MPLRRLACLALTIAALSLPAAAADRFFMYNQTESTAFDGVYLAPAGTGHWGSNQALNDQDKAIDPSERLPIKDASRGLFDVRLVDETGRVCVVHGIDLTKDTTFEIHDGDLSDCH